MGVGLLTLSLFLFWWAIRTNLKKPLSIAFTDYKPIHIVTEGPYRYIRHPLYTSYMIAWLGVPVVLGSAAAFIPGIILFYYYYKAAKLEENQFSLSEMKENYEIYRSNTGMFFPRL
jgi:protein-S-isoprenylcysteine O-methyltransferase Ste14